MQAKPDIFILTANETLRVTLADFFSGWAEVIATPESAMALAVIDADTAPDLSAAMRELQKKNAQPLPFLLLASEKLEVPASLAPLTEILYKPLKIKDIYRAWDMLRQKQSRMAQPAMELGDCVFAGAERVLACGQKTVTLTQKEAELLTLLHKQEGRQLAAETLLREIWGIGEGINTHTLQTHIYRLRAKIRSLGSHIRIHAFADGYQLDIAQ